MAGDLKRPDQDYLKYPSTRAYLLGVLASPLPRLMVGDREHLAEIFSAAEREQEKLLQAQEEKDLEQRRKEAARAQEQARQHRMANFAQALFRPSP